MAQLEEILDEYCSGKSGLVETASSLERIRQLGQVDEAHVQELIERLMAAGRIAPEAAAMLTGPPAAPAVPVDVTMYRAAGMADDHPAAAPEPPASTHDASGSSSSGWRKWAATDNSAAAVGVGTVLRDRFVIEQVVGEGGMGLVFRARDRRRDEARDRNPFVAIKVLGDEFKSHPDSLMSLQREARRMQQLSHPNIASVYDFDRDGPHVYLVMELLEGESLDRVLERHAGVGLPMEQARLVLDGAASALRHAHSRGLVHSDFKPANVFMKNVGEVKVIDFGIARIVKDSTQAGDAAQTVFDAGKLGAWTNAYASPEQMLDGSTPDPRDDVYALGLVTFEMLTGKHPFGRKSAIEARFRDMKLEAVPALTERQNAVLASALHFDREHRLADPVVLARSLAADADEGVVLPSGIRPESPDGRRPAATARKSNLRVGLFAVVALAWLGFFAAFWVARQGPEEPAPQSGSDANATAATAPPTTTVTPTPPAPISKVASERKRPQTTKPLPAPTPTAEAAATVAVNPEPGSEAGSASASESGMAGTGEAEVPPAESAGATDVSEKPALYRWVDGNGVIQFGETPPAEFAESAVKVMDL